MDFSGSGLFEELLKRSFEYGDVTITATLMEEIKKEILKYQEQRDSLLSGLWKNIAYARLGRRRHNMKPEDVEIVQDFLEKEL